MNIEQIYVNNRFKIGDEVYIMRNNKIFVGRVKAVYEMDSLNTKYLIDGDTYSEWCFDTKVYGSVTELLDSLKGCIGR